jgi:hypothetical protein
MAQSVFSCFLSSFVFFFFFFEGVGGWRSHGATFGLALVSGFFFFLIIIIHCHECCNIDNGPSQIIDM